MAWTQGQLDALDEAIAQGTLKVKYADKEIEYRSLNEMLRLREIIAKALGQRACANDSIVYPVVSKGLDCERG